MTSAGRPDDRDTGPPPDRVDPNRVRRDLRARGRAALVVWSDVTESTQDDAMAGAVAGVAHGALFGTDRQMRGRGRRGRRWLSDPHGLTFSVVVRGRGSTPPSWPVLATAVGVVQAVERRTGLALDIKWPNDLVMGARKVGGVLAELRAGAAVVGVGLNVHAAPAITDGAPATALADRAASPIDRSALLAEMYDRILAAVDAPHARRAAVSRIWRCRSAVLGRPVTVIDGSRRLAGVAEGFGPEGQLHLRTEDGGLLTIVVGDVSLRVAAPARP